MKKLITMALVLVLALCAVVFAGCARQNEVDDDGKISVVTTIFAPYDFARAIAGDAANITMLLSPGSESHSFEPTPQDIIKIQKCDVFIHVGGESDEWVRSVLASMDTSNMKIVTMMDCVETFEGEIVEGMQDDHDHEEAHEYDEHVWTSPRNAKLIVRKIADALCAVDADNAEIYNQNTRDYQTKLDALDAEFRAVVAAATRKTIVFGDRFPFRYLAQAYGLSYFAAFPGCSTESEASAATVSFLIDKIKDEGIPVIFHVELSNQKMANTISEATGAKVCLLHACHNISRDEFQSGRTYLDIMTANVATLKEALG